MVFLCCLNAVLRATAFGAVYYFFFLLVITYWACNRSLGRVFAKMLACLIPIIFINITVIFWYQFQYFQDSDQTTPFNIWGRCLTIKLFGTQLQSRFLKIVQPGGFEDLQGLYRPKAVLLPSTHFSHLQRSFMPLPDVHAGGVGGQGNSPG